MLVSVVSNGFTQVVQTRQVPAGSYHEVVNIQRPGQNALVVCVKCGQTWDQGCEAPQGCK